MGELLGRKVSGNRGLEEKEELKTPCIGLGATEPSVRVPYC